MKTMRSLLFLLALILLPACTEDPGFVGQDVTVTMTGLTPLGSGAHYALWFTYPENIAPSGKNPVVSHGDAEFVLIGEFRVDAAGQMLDLNGNTATFTIPDGYNPGLFIDAVVSVEQDGDSDDHPDAHMLSGEFEGTATRGIAELEMSGGDAFGVGINNPERYDTGRYFLDTPTSVADGDSASGVWFGIYSNGNVEPGLNLLQQPINAGNEGWTYEAWLVRNPGSQFAEYISMGTFDIPSQADRNGPGPDAGPNVGDAWPVPGDDFIVGGGRMLTDGAYGLIISLQPLNISLDYPFLPLLRRDTIPPLAIRETGTLWRAARPVVEVTVER